MWKEEDKKFAYVFMKKGFMFEFPDMFTVDEEMQEVEKIKASQCY